MDVLIIIQHVIYTGLYIICRVITFIELVCYLIIVYM
ncbi:hypothetical protein HL670_03394 [Serratia plymuthica]|nr:hypothetical protein HL670_03394 [Serratia plymuthica]